MTEPKDPTRFLDAGSGVPDELRRLFEAGRSDLPTSADLARLAARLGPELAAPATPPAGGGLSPLAKLGLGVVGGGLVAAGVWFATGEKPVERDVPGSATEAASVAPATEQPSGTASDAPALAPSAPDAPASAADAAQGQAPASARPEAPRTAEKRAPSVPEDQLLEQARRALSGSPERALSLTRQHQLDFPRGALSQEREVIAIEALKRLGRTGEAARRRERFERLYPQSAHQRKLDAPQPER